MGDRERVDALLDEIIRLRAENARLMDLLLVPETPEFRTQRNPVITGILPVAG